MRIVRVSLWLLAAALLTSPALALARSNPTAVRGARAAAEAWLALVDAGKYGDSYDAAAEFFRKAITKEKWEAALKQVRTPLGAVASRKLLKATYTRSVPGAPPGEYVIIQYQTSFKNRAGSVETITPLQEADKKWRVSGYFIK